MGNGLLYHHISSVQVNFHIHNSNHRSFSYTEAALKWPYSMAQYSRWPEVLLKAVFNSSCSLLWMSLSALSKSSLVNMFASLGMMETVQHDSEWGKWKSGYFIYPLRRSMGCKCLFRKNQAWWVTWWRVLTLVCSEATSSWSSLEVLYLGVLWYYPSECLICIGSMMLGLGEGFFSEGYVSHHFRSWQRQTDRSMNEFSVAWLSWQTSSIKISRHNPCWYTAFNFGLFY